VFLVRTLWHALYNCEKQSLEIDFYLGETRSYKQNALAICTLNWTINSRDLDVIRSAAARIDSKEMMNLWEKSHHIILMGL
jgi:hypothetical protein